MTSTRFRWIASAVFFLLVVNAHAEVLRLGVGTSPGSSFPPYMVLANDGRTYSGLAYDVLNAVLARTGDTVVPVYLPAPRLFLGVTQGVIDLDLFSNPRWRGDLAKESVFTEPYLSTRTLVVYRSDLPDPPRTLSDLVGRRFVGVNSFSYPGLDALVRQGQVGRDDAPSTALVLKMLENRHGTIGVADEFVFYDLQRSEGYTDLVAGFPLSAPTEVSMRFPKRLADVARRFSKAIRGMKADGTLAALVKNYN